MTMEWNSRDYRFNQNGGNDMDMIKGHNERMSEFRSTHTSISMVNAPRLSDAALIGNMESLEVGRNMLEEGGSIFLEGAEFWSALVPVLKVARYKLSQN